LLVGAASLLLRGHLPRRYLQDIEPSNDYLQPAAREGLKRVILFRIYFSTSTHAEGNGEAGRVGDPASLLKGQISRSGAASASLIQSRRES
jgi:hypothetical protein